MADVLDKAPSVAMGTGGNRRENGRTTDATDSTDDITITRHSLHA
jgi:hypothetical protein